MLLIIVGIILWLIWLWSRRDLYRFTLQFPTLYGIPLIGCIHKVFPKLELLGPIHAQFMRLKTKTYLVWIGPKMLLATHDADLVSDVTLSKDLLNKSSFYDMLKPFLGNGVLTVDEPIWHETRKKLNPSFKHNVILSFLPIFNKAKRNLFNKFNIMARTGQQYYIQRILGTAFLGISVETTMGKTMKEGDTVDEEVLQGYMWAAELAVSKFAAYALKIEKLFSFGKKMAQSKDIIQRFIMNLLQQSLLSTTSNNLDTDLTKKPNIFINQALKIHEQGDFTLDDIALQSNIIIAASFETTSSTTFTCLCMLAMHPEIQERLFTDIKTVLPDKNMEISIEHMEALPYLEMVINETMRCFPALPLVGRQAFNATKLRDDLTLPNGLQIIISIYDLHRDPEHWGPNAHKFDPDHFLPANVKNRHRGAFIPFSKGPRNCPGWQYATFALKIILAGLIRNFRFETDMKVEDLQPIMNIVLKYEKYPQFRIYHRED